jgi:hypothetical protein
LARPGERWRPCANAASVGCNWLVPAEAADAFCEACRLNRTIPDLSVPGNLEKWAAIEIAKRRLVYALMRLGLPLTSRHEDEARGLAFDFLADVPGAPVMTGHEDGLITLNIAEADSAERERRRVELGEPYRTMLGHLRHEVGHYVQMRLVTGDDRLDRCRELFGDETADYQAAIDRHYAEGAPEGWEASYITTYATMHPFEDFAETFAHYLHIADTCETAAEEGLITVAPTAFGSFRDLVRGVWIPLSIALNQINRSMGKDDLYPFVIPEPVLDKLDFVASLAFAPDPDMQ